MTSFMTSKRIFDDVIFRVFSKFSILTFQKKCLGEMVYTKL